MHVLESPLVVTTYQDLARQCCAWAREPRCRALEFANTQTVTMRRHDPEFARLLSTFDALVPDGMPLVWCLNAVGAGLHDRVYGPTFMRTFLETVPAGFTHYLLGGSEECGRRLEARFTQANPQLRFVGRYHGRALLDGTLEDEDQVMEELQRLSPDFIWVGLGTPRQQAWIHKHKPRLERGFIFSVGFAFDVNAGLKADAPRWMQRLGLTWAHRLASEPGRLAQRYLKWNSLFLYYLLRDGLRGRAFGA